MYSLHYINDTGWVTGVIRRAIRGLTVCPASVYACMFAAFAHGLSGWVSTWFQFWVVTKRREKSSQICVSCLPTHRCLCCDWPQPIWLAVTCWQTSAVSNYSTGQQEARARMPPHQEVYSMCLAVSIRIIWVARKNVSINKVHIMQYKSIQKSPPSPSGKCCDKQNPQRSSSPPLRITTVINMEAYRRAMIPYIRAVKMCLMSWKATACIHLYQYTFSSKNGCMTKKKRKEEPNVPSCVKLQMYFIKNRLENTHT